MALRIVFIGASDLGWACCEALLSQGANVVGILTAPQEFRISWSKNPVTNVRHRSFDNLAKQYGVPVKLMRTRMAETEDWLTEREPDLLVVIGWYHMIGSSLRKLARYGAVGIHASLLPKYRGGAPLVWAIINGSRETGVTLFYLEDGVDDGDIIWQEAFAIADSDNIAEVVERSTEVSLRLVRRFIPMIDDGTAPRNVQDHASATYVPQRRPEDGLLDWNTKSARQAYDWIRAQTRPYPGAFTYAGGRKMTIWRAVTADGIEFEGASPGQIVGDSTPLVVCADGGLVQLDEVQIGERLFSGHEVVRERWRLGERLDSIALEERA